jgi:hypothetical protein
MKLPHVSDLTEYVPTPSADPVYLYTNDLVGIFPERQINNGQPSFHAALISSASPADGEHVVHIGTGDGYYTAILAHLVGASAVLGGGGFWGMQDLIRRQKGVISTRVDYTAGDVPKAATAIIALM